MKFYLNESEIGWMKQFHPDHVHLEREERLIEINESLGAVASEYGYRVAEDSEVPGVRNLRGITPNQVIFDEAHNLSEVYDSGEPSVTSQKWLEHRRVCRRTLLECLSGEQH